MTFTSYLNFPSPSVVNHERHTQGSGEITTPTREVLKHFDKGRRRKIMAATQPKEREREIREIRETMTQRLRKLQTLINIATIGELIRNTATIEE